MKRPNEMTVRSMAMRNPLQIVPATETAVPLPVVHIVSPADLPSTFPSPPTVYALHEIPEQVGQCTHPHEKPKAFQFEVRYIFGNVPRRQRSIVRRKTKLTQVNDGSSILALPAIEPNQLESNSGNLKDVKLMDEAKSTAQRKRKSKLCVNTIDFQPCTPRLRVRGQVRGPVGNRDALTQEGKLDSNTFEDILKIIWCGLSEEKRNPFACLDSLWFSIYAQNSGKEKVLSWIKKVNIFSKHYVLVPIVMWSHWSLLILCHLGERDESNTKTPCMLLLDSMQTIGPKRLEPKIRKFVLDIHKSLDLPVSKKSIHKIPFKVPKVPQQKNGEECGKYVLYFMKLFLENAPDSFNISEGYPYFMKEDWFTLEGFDNFWQRLVEDMKVKTDITELEVFV